MSDVFLGLLYHNAANDVTLIRVNPDFPLASHPAITDKVISIMSGGLAAVTEIDRHLSKSTPRTESPPTEHLYSDDDDFGMEDESNPNSSSEEGELSSSDE